MEIEFYEVKVMYVDVGLEKHNKTEYRVILYREDIMETITSNTMKMIAEHIRNIVKANKQIVYIDDRGFGKCLTDCLKQIGISYVILKHSNLSLNIPK